MVEQVIDAQHSFEPFDMVKCPVPDCVLSFSTSVVHLQAQLYPYLPRGSVHPQLAHAPAGGGMRAALHGATRLRPSLQPALPSAALSGLHLHHSGKLPGSEAYFCIRELFPHQFSYNIN
jgi:hypothetical protein